MQETFASLYTNAGGVPGSDLADTPSSILNLGDDIFTFSSAELLAANTSYWIVLNAGALVNTGGLQMTATSTVTSAYGITYDGTDTNSGSGFVPVVSHMTQFANLELDSSVVATPEPESLALPGTGALTLWLGRRRRRGGG